MNDELAISFVHRFSERRNRARFGVHRERGPINFSMVQGATTDERGCLGLDPVAQLFNVQRHIEHCSIRAQFAYCHSFVYLLSISLRFLWLFFV